MPTKRNGLGIVRTRGFLGGREGGERVLFVVVLERRLEAVACRVHLFNTSVATEEQRHGDVSTGACLQRCVKR